MSATIHVVAGALFDEEGRVLLAQRPPRSHLAGGWEFPGGKLEAGETRLAALARELREELGVEVIDARPLIKYEYAYPARIVLLDLWRVSRYRGVPASMEGQPLKWVKLEELADAGLLEADRPMVGALRGFQS